MRGSNLPTPEVTNELLTLRAQLTELRAVAASGSATDIETELYIKYKPAMSSYSSASGGSNIKSKRLPVSKIFLAIAHQLRNQIGRIPYNDIAKFLEFASSSHSPPEILPESKDDISLALEALDLIKAQTDRGSGIGRDAYYSLTDHGLKTLFSLIVKKPS